MDLNIQKKLIIDLSNYWEKKANLVLTPIFDVSENFGWSIIHGLLIIQMYINKEYDGIHKRQEGTIQQVLGGLEKTLYK